MLQRVDDLDHPSVHKEKKQWPAAVTGLLALIATSCGSPPPPASPEELQKAVQRADSKFAELAADGYSGAVVVTHRGQPIFEKYAGSASEKTPFGPDVRVDVASVTKPITAMGILKLHEQGKLRLDDPLSRWFPNAPADKRNVTVRQLLAHSSGITDFAKGVMDYTPISKEEMAKRLLSEPLDFPPGSEWSYSNGGYNLLGQIIGSASGQSMESYLQSEVFAPAGVKASYDPRRFLPREVAGVHRDGRWRDIAKLADPASGPFWGLWGAGGIFISARDMARLIDAFMEGKIVSLPLVKLATAPEIAEGMLSDSGLGWVLIRRGTEEPVIYYSGGTLHASSAIRHYKSRKLTFVSLSNSVEGVSAKQANRKVAHGFLGLRAWNPFRPEG